MVPIDALPSLHGDEFSRMVRWTKWQRSLGIPTEVFIEMLEQSRVATADDDLDEPLARKAGRKPFYLDFQSALSLHHFWGRLEGRAGRIRFLECVPSSNDGAFMIDGQAHTGEVVLELTGSRN